MNALLEYIICSVTVCKGYKSTAVVIIAGVDVAFNLLLGIDAELYHIVV